MGNLLFLCHRIPYPPNKGDKIRAYHWLKHLVQNHDVHLGCFVDDPSDLQHVAELERRVVRLAAIPLNPTRARRRALARCRPGRPLSVGYYEDRRMRQFVYDTAERWPLDAVVVFSAAMAPYVEQLTMLPRVLDMVDVDSEKFAAYARNSRMPSRFLWSRESRTLRRFERTLAATLDLTLFVSAAEETRFLELAPEARGATSWVPNGVDAARFSPGHRFSRPFPPGPMIVFTGAMDYRPNVEACVWFANLVLPRLRAGGREVQFCIVGANPTSTIRRLGEQCGVIVTGFVADTRPYLAHADVAVAPLAIGRGVQNKVLEAMAMAVPVVATEAAFTGVDAEPGRDLLVADGPAAITAAINTVLAGGHEGLGPAGRASVLRNHNWNAAFVRFDAALDELLSRSGRVVRNGIAMETVEVAGR